MDETEVPQFFICPISLQIMRDPVTAITGITYDRESMEHWLFQANNTTCPVTQQPLPRDSYLTPNHTLRRLIQAWCSTKGLDRIPTPKPPLNKLNVLSLIRGIQVQEFRVKSLRKLEVLAFEHERNRICMAEAGVIQAIAGFVVACYRSGETMGLEEALSTLYLLRTESMETKLLLDENNDQMIDSLIWVLGLEINNHLTVKSHAISVLKKIIGKANSEVLGRLKPEFFQKIVRALREGISQEGVNAALHIMLEACPWGRNRLIMVENEAIFELIELELGSPENRTSELILGILFHLCYSADGRAQLLSHAAAVAVITKRLLNVSPTANDRAVLILSLICKFSGTPMVLEEMVRVGAVAKLCMVLQLNCDSYLKDKALEILRAHSQVWKASPCMEITTLSNYPG
ncbi:E3 ubiquitin-protein ligase PUB24-like [Diospyros lotus]|uniref:E3 ubiquitin-protein ligase PUB24-like n=1 Tax=Diospyros lotus TaxID=55363 RepID=UPI0022510ACB|nr:E3 ubiquitin-protein ligase PUB24-like [Diospyros lotus]